MRPEFTITERCTRKNLAGSGLLSKLVKVFQTHDLRSRSEVWRSVRRFDPFHRQSERIAVSRYKRLGPKT